MMLIIINYDAAQFASDVLTLLLTGTVPNIKSRSLSVSSLDSESSLH